MKSSTLRFAVALNLIPGVGSISAHRFLSGFGSAENFFDAEETAIAAVEGIGARKAAILAPLRVQALRDAETEIALADKHGIRILTPDDSDYPTPLRFIHDPPNILYVKGTLDEADLRAVALVGSRRATAYGRMQAERLSRILAARGYTVVSGLARGIDTAAHRGALEAGGRTIAVLGSGLLHVYPTENKELAEKIAASGALVSEFPLDTTPERGNFPRRNRIISGLSLGTVVVEADLRSGALITARLAAEQGKEVFAVPGNIDSPASRGAHALIRDGAKLVTTPEDIWEELGEAPSAEPSPEKPPPSLSDEENKIYEHLSSTPLSPDDLSARAGIPVAEVARTITLLEIKRWIKRLPSGYVKNQR